MFTPEQEIIFALTTVITALLLAFIIFLAFTLVTQRRVVSLQKSLLKAEIQAIERERERLASDLHDSLGPTISALIILNRQIETTHPPSLKIRETIDTNLHLISDQVREISHDLIPRFFKGITVEQVLQKAIQDSSVMCKHQGINVEFASDADLQLKMEENLYLYRITQELLHNACKHSKALQVSLFCRLRENVFTLTYQDNGIGYNVNHSSEGLGLRNIQSRVNALGGTYSVQSGNQNGTQLVIKIKQDFRSEA